MFFYFPRLLSCLYSRCRGPISVGFDHLRLKVRELQIGVSAVSKRSFEQLMSGFKGGFDYISRQRARFFQKLKYLPKEQPISAEKKDESNQSICLLPIDAWQIIAKFFDRNSRLNSSLSCKSLYRKNKLLQTRYYLSKIPSNLPDDYKKIRSIVLSADTKISADSFKILLRCNHLEGLDLSGIDSVNNSALNTLKDLKSLKILTLASCCNITDGGLNVFKNSSIEKSLRYLDLSYCSQITDGGIQFMGRGYLKGLNLQHCTQIEGWGLKSFTERANSTLEYLNLNHHQYLSRSNRQNKSEKSAHHTFTHIRSIRSLCFAASDVDGDLIRTICNQFTSLALLDLSSCQSSTCQDLMQLTSLSNLKSLTLSSCNVYDSMVLALPALKNLRLLDLSNCIWLTQICAEPVCQLPKLKDLYLCGCAEALANRVLQLIKAQKRSPGTPTVHFPLARAPIAKFILDSPNKKKKNY